MKCKLKPTAFKRIANGAEELDCGAHLYGFSLDDEYDVYAVGRFETNSSALLRQGTRMPVWLDLSKLEFSDRQVPTGWAMTTLCHEEVELVIGYEPLMRSEGLLEVLELSEDGLTLFEAVHESVFD